MAHLPMKGFRQVSLARKRPLVPGGKTDDRAADAIPPVYLPWERLLTFFPKTD
jgi:hypothetical protein